MLSETKLDHIPTCSEKPKAHFKSQKNKWIGSLQGVAKTIGVTKGALAAFGLAVAEREQRPDTLVFEAISVMAGANITPCGFCDDTVPTRIGIHPEICADAERPIYITSFLNIFDRSSERESEDTAFKREEVAAFID
ncbi:hypothetical protein K438DRAFT_1768507 [Mycena galopus ATCC 62051]|nr:hypothetical protein K438DRAFT_1768507 [Mycena galopus ATCC 62051]